MLQENRVCFLGSKAAGLECVSTMYALQPRALIGIITIDDRKDVRSIFPKFKSFAKKKKIPLYVARNRQEADAAIRRWKPDLCMVCGWYWLIGETVLQSVRKGFLGFHFSTLPQYRGFSPAVWAMINGEKEIGISLFSFSKDMDAGPIWQRRRVTVSPNEDIASVLKKLEGQQVKILRQCYRKILKGKIRPVPQNQRKASYFRQRFPSDGLIDWQKSSAEIHNFIRAQSRPYPGAFTYYKNRKLIVWKARPKKTRSPGMPGQVARITREGVMTICGDGTLLVLKEVQHGAKKGAAPRLIKSVNARFTSKD